MRELLGPSLIHDRRYIISEIGTELMSGVPPSINARRATSERTTSRSPEEELRLL